MTTREREDDWLIEFIGTGHSDNFFFNEQMVDPDTKAAVVAYHRYFLHTDSDDEQGQSETSRLETAGSAEFIWERVPGSILERIRNSHQQQLPHNY